MIIDKKRVKRYIILFFKDIYSFFKINIIIKYTNEVACINCIILIINAVFLRGCASNAFKFFASNIF